MVDLHEELKAQLELIQKRMEHYANKDRIEGPNLQEGDMVYLLRHTRGHKMPNIKTNRPNDKLDFRKIGPFKILKKIGNVNYELEMPEGMQLKYPVFHVSLLEKAQIDEATGRPILDEIIIIEDEEEWEVEKVLAVRRNPEENNRIEYQVRWKGYDPIHDTWEPVESFNTMELIQDFQENLGLYSKLPTPATQRAKKQPKKKAPEFPPMPQEDLNLYTPNRRFRKKKD